MGTRGAQMASWRLEQLRMWANSTSPRCTSGSFVGGTYTSRGITEKVVITGTHAPDRHRQRDLRNRQGRAQGRPHHSGQVLTAMRNRKGYTLIELMVALVVLLLVTGSLYKLLGEHAAALAGPGRAGRPAVERPHCVGGHSRRAA